MEKPLFFDTRNSSDSSIIWLHGLGATKHDFESVAKLLQREVLPNTRFILPQAPIQPVTLNNGIAMPSWYDIKDFSFPSNINREEMDLSSQTVISLIEAEIKQGIPLNRIILVGFSQGGAVALNTAFVAYKKTVGGVIALSTYAPTFDVNLSFNKDQQQIPTLHLHGSLDPVVPIQLGKEAYQFLTEKKIDTTWYKYPMQHEVCNDEITDIALWLQARLT